MSQREPMIRVGNGSFWRGLITGLGLAAVGVALAAGIITRRGVEVAIPTGAIAQRMEGEVREAVRREMPAALAALEAELSAQVSAEAGRRLSEARIELGGFVVPLPPAAVQQAEQALAQAVRTGLAAAVRQVDVDGLAGRLGGGAARLAEDRLRQFLHGQVFTVEVVPGVEVPVRLIPR